MTCIATLKAGSSGTVTVSFADSDGAPVIPSSVNFTVRCMTTNQDIRADVDAGVPASTMDITVTSSDNALIDPVNEREHRRVIVTANYGTDDDVVETYDYYIRNPAK